MKESLTVVIPAFNEQDNINQSLDNVQGALKGLVDDYEIIVVNDGSRDNTEAVASARARQDPRIKWVSNDRNRGYGYSFWRGVMLATKDHVTVYPADNDFLPGSLTDMVREIGKADILSSYMINQHDRHWPRRTLSQTFVLMMNVLFSMNLKYFNGPFICRREILQKLQVRSMGLTILAECKVRLIKKGSSYLEVPFAHVPRAIGHSTALSPKSIKAVLSAVFCLYKDIYWGTAS